MRYSHDVGLNTEALEICKEFNEGAWGIQTADSGERHFVDINKGGNFANLVLDGSSSKQLIEMCVHIVDKHEDELEKIFKRHAKTSVLVKDFVREICTDTADACPPPKPASRSRKEL